MIAQSLIGSSYYKPCKTGELVESSVSTTNPNPSAYSPMILSPDEKHMYLIRGGAGTGTITTGGVANWIMKLDILKYSINSLNGQLTYSSTKSDTVPGIYPWYTNTFEFSESGGNLYIVLNNNYNNIVLAYSRNLTTGELTLVSTSPQFSGVFNQNFIILKSFLAYVIQPGKILGYPILPTNGSLGSYPTEINTAFSQPYAIQKPLISPDEKYMYIIRSNMFNVYSFNLGQNYEATFVASSLVDTVTPLDSAENPTSIVWCKKDDLVYVYTNRYRLICYQWEYTSGRLTFKFVNQLANENGGYDNQLFVSSSPEENLYNYYPTGGGLITYKRTKNSGEVNSLYKQQFSVYDKLIFSKKSNFVYRIFYTDSSIVKSYKRTACQVEPATICHPISGEIFKNGVSQGVYIFREVWQYNSIAKFIAYTSDVGQYWKLIIDFRYPSPGTATVIISISTDIGSSTSEIYPGCNTTAFASNGAGVIYADGNTVNIQWSEPRPIIY